MELQWERFRLSGIKIGRQIGRHIGREIGRHIGRQIGTGCSDRQAQDVQTGRQMQRSNQKGEQIGIQSFDTFLRYISVKCFTIVKVTQINLSFIYFIHF